MKAGWGIQQMGPLPSAPEAVTELSLERRSWDKTCASRFAAIGESPAIYRGESVGGKSRVRFSGRQALGHWAGMVAVTINDYERCNQGKGVPA